MTTRPSDAVIIHALQRYECPDCDASVALVHMSGDPDGVWHIDVGHDDTCPALARMEGR